MFACTWIILVLFGTCVYRKASLFHLSFDFYSLIFFYFLIIFVGVSDSPTVTYQYSMYNWINALIRYFFFLFSFSPPPPSLAEATCSVVKVMVLESGSWCFFFCRCLVTAFVGELVYLPSPFVLFLQEVFLRVCIESQVSFENFRFLFRFPSGHFIL